MAASSRQELEMIEQGQELTPDLVPDGTIPPPIIRYSFHPSDSDSVTGRMTPQQVKDRRAQQGTHKSLLPVAAVPDDVKLQHHGGSMQSLLAIDLDKPPAVVDDIDMTLQRKVSRCRQEGGVGCRTMHRARIEAKH